MHCCDSHLCSQAGGFVLSNQRSSRTHRAPAEQNQVLYTPRCPSVVLWTPCSGGVRVFEPGHQGFGEAATTRK